MTTKDPLFDITGKVILITGSVRGIGYFLAENLGLRGAEIIVNGRTGPSVAEAVKRLEAQGVRATPSVFDVTNEGDVERAVGEVLKAHGRIDVLINNAGVQIRHPLEEFPAEDWDRILEVNLKGAFLTGKHVGRAMIAAGRGKIINICSMQSELGRNSITPYAASKGGLKMLTRGMATEWGRHNLQVNGIGPGYFVTDMTRSLYENEEFSRWLCNRVPANRWGDPQELVGAAVFLSSAASDYVNGQIIYVDGGMLCCV